MNHHFLPQSPAKDRIIADLTKKKRALLKSLLVLSIQTALDTQRHKANRSRSDLLSMLTLNDQAVEAREKQTGIKARDQEDQLFSDIASLLSSIQQNNQDSIARLESEVKAYKAEKNQLKKGKKISNYVNQTKTFHQNTLKKQSKSQVLKGIL